MISLFVRIILNFLHFIIKINKLLWIIKIQKNKFYLSDTFDEWYLVIIILNNKRKKSSNY